MKKLMCISMFLVLLISLCGCNNASSSTTSVYVVPAAPTAPAAPASSTTPATPTVPTASTTPANPTAPAIPSTPVETSAPTVENYSVPLVDLDVIKDTNPEDKSSDIAIGNWKDSLGNRHLDSLRFWVVRKEGYDRVESITYQLGGHYTELFGGIYFDAESENDAVMEIEFWLDGIKIYESGDVAYNANISFSVDVTDGKVLTIQCLTAQDDFGYCIVSGSLS